jgi:glycosyltransferase involved in cell wall biosynthesis
MKKKILIIIDNLGIGGAQENTLAFVQNMYEYKIKIISFYGDDAYSEKLKTHGAEVIFLSRINGSQIKKIFVIPIVFLRFLRVKKNISDYDWINIKLPFSLLLCSFFNFIRLKNVSFFVESSFFQLNTIEKFIYKFCLPKYKNILLAKTVRDSFININIENSNVYDGFAFISNRESNNPIIYQDKINLLFIARLIPQKGLINTINIIKKHNELFSDKIIQLHVIGDGPDHDKMKTYCTLKNISFVNFYGYVNNLNDYYQNATGIIKTSYNEPANSVVREALILGKIVFSTIDIESDYVFVENGLIHEINKSEIDFSANKINEVVNREIDLEIKNVANQMFGNNFVKSFYRQIIENSSN